MLERIHPCDIEDNLDKFKLYLEKVIRFFGSISLFPIKAEMFEQYIWCVLSICYGKNNVEWEPGSHKRTIDIVIRKSDHDIRLALKSGKYKNNDYITMSSYRLTSYVVRNDPALSLRNMLNAVKMEYRNMDYLMLIAREERNNVRRYQIYLIPSEIFNSELFFDPGNWYYRLEKAFYNFYLRREIAETLKFNASIIGSMSYQLWYNISLQLVDKYKLFNKPLEFSIDSIKDNLINLAKNIIRGELIS